MDPKLDLSVYTKETCPGYCLKRASAASLRRAYKGKWLCVTAQKRADLSLNPRVLRSSFSLFLI
jgi:hypothetical protein